MRNANSATGKSCEDESLRKVLRASKFERRRACWSGHNCGVCGVAGELGCSLGISAISVQVFVLQYYVRKWWCRVYWDVEVVVAVQGRHVKMYSPRKTWESSQPYGWQASRAGRLEGRKNTDLGMVMNLFSILCSVACMISLEANKMYKMINPSRLRRMIEFGMNMLPLKTMHGVFSSTTPPMHLARAF